MLPVVLHHGLFGYGDIRLGPVQISYFKGIDRAIAARGHPVIVSRVHPTAAIQTRARQLKKHILTGLQSAGCARKRIILIAHSMGGLDARYMISRLDMAGHVAALITISSPHHGSPYADWCIRHLGQRLGGLRLMRLLGLDVTGIADLTTSAGRKFNDEIADDPDVRYFSISASRPQKQMPAWFRHSHKLVFDAEGDNDGLVSVASAAWGRHLGTWPADHLHAINHHYIRISGTENGDISPYYLAALDKVNS